MQYLLQEKILVKKKALFYALADLKKKSHRVLNEVVWWALRKLVVE